MRNRTGIIAKVFLYRTCGGLGRPGLLTEVSPDVWSRCQGGPRSGTVGHLCPTGLQSWGTTTEQTVLEWAGGGAQESVLKLKSEDSSLH